MVTENVVVGDGQYVCSDALEVGGNVCDIERDRHLNVNTALAETSMSS